MSIKKASAASGDSMISLSLMAILLTAVTVQAATLFDLFWPKATYFSLAAQAVIVLFYFISPFRRFNATVLVLGLGLLTFFIFEHLVFSRNSGVEKNFNSILSYLPILSFVAFAGSGCSMQSILRVFIVVILAYLAFYVFGYSYMMHANFGPARGIHSGDLERGKRLYLAAAFASFVAFYAQTNGKLNIFVRIFIFGLSVVAILLSGSRTFQLLFVVILALSALKMIGAWVRLAIFSTFLLISLVLLLGVWIDWNPFLYMQWDASSYARSLEYPYAIRSIQSHWLLGTGIASSFSSLQQYLGTPLYEPVYVTDLGVIGPLVLLGIPGLIGFIAATYFCIVAPMRYSAGPELQALRLNCVLCGVYGVISPAIILEQNAVFLALLFAVWVRYRKSGPGVAPAAVRQDVIHQPVMDALPKALQRWPTKMLPLGSASSWRRRISPPYSRTAPRPRRPL